MILQGKKIFCVGFQKTGTTSLTRALRDLGFSIGAAMRRIKMEVPADAADPTDQIHAIVREIVDAKDAIQDSPSPFLYEAFDRWYPGSKFILTVRDSESWLKSYSSYFGDENNTLRRWMYKVDSFRGNEAHYQRVYETQNEEIRAYFASRPDDLLVMDLTKGDGWLELVNFLGRDFLPPFPHANKGGQDRKAKSAKRAVRREVRSTIASRLKTKQA